MAPHYQYEIFKSIRGGHSTVQLRKSAGDITEETPPISIPDGPLQLRITSDAEAYHFYYATEPGKWNLIGSGTGRLIASEIANVWTGAYLGMYSTGNGTVSAAPADFDWADYRILAPESPDF
jgi:alpha-N-arabinofuranosidase